MTRTMESSCLLAVFAAAATVLASETVARADDREQCAAAADQAQQLRDEGKYRRAREQLLICARDLCPAPIKRDCLDWLTQLETIAPTIVLAAKEGTKDLSDVKVYVDGALVTERLDGRPLQMDLGKHAFKFEYAGQTKEEDFIIGAGQKNRSLSVVFAPAAAATPVAPPSKEGGGSLVPAIVLAGVGVVALGSFAVFGLGGKSDVADLQSCKGHCDSGAVDKARTKLIVADISLGIGIVALGVATYLFVTRPKVDAEVKTGKTGLASARFDFGPVTGGGAGSVQARF